VGGIESFTAPGHIESEMIMWLVPVVGEKNGFSENGKLSGNPVRWVGWLGGGLEGEK